MWNTRSPGTPGDRLWRYIKDLRRGDDHDPDEELTALLPMSRLVSEALKGGGEGPEAISEARLRMAIARSRERERPPARRSWALPALATAGWAAASLGFGLFVYQLGINQGMVRMRLAEAAVAPPAQPMLTQAPPPAAPAPAPRRAAHRLRHLRTKRHPAESPMPPAVSAKELGSVDDAMALASPEIPAADASPDSRQDNLMREANTQLTQGKWDKAADSFEQAASQKPADEASLDALHISGVIAERALKDPRRAGELYRREIELARQIIERRETHKDAPAQPVKMRLARAMTSAGLLEKNPRMIRQAAQESQGIASPDSKTTESNF